MTANREKFKQFVIEQLKDYDEWREASPDGYAEIITDEAVKLFCQPNVVEQGEQLVCDNHRADLEHFMNYSESICKSCGKKV